MPAKLEQEIRRRILPLKASNARGEYHRITKNNRKNKNNHTNLKWDIDKIKARIIIDGSLCTAIVDTGASRSFIAPAQVDKLQTPPKFRDVNVGVTLADGHNVHIKHAIEAAVTLSDKTFRLELLIMRPAKSSVVLGMDFLSLFNTTFTCAGLRIKGAPKSRYRSQRRPGENIDKGEFSHQDPNALPPSIKKEILSVPKSTTNTDVGDGDVDIPPTLPSTTSYSGSTSYTTFPFTYDSTSCSTPFNSAPPSVMVNHSSEDQGITILRRGSIIPMPWYRSWHLLQTSDKPAKSSLPPTPRIITLQEAPEKLREECIILAQNIGRYPKKFSRWIKKQLYCVTISPNGTIKIVLKNTTPKVTVKREILQPNPFPATIKENMPVPESCINTEEGDVSPLSLPSDASSSGSKSSNSSTHTGSVSSSTSEPRSTGQPAPVRRKGQGIKILRRGSIIPMPWYSSWHLLQTHERPGTSPSHPLSRIITLQEAPEQLREKCIPLAKGIGRYPKKFIHRIKRQLYHVTIARNGTVKIELKNNAPKVTVKRELLQPNLFEPTIKEEIMSAPESSTNTENGDGIVGSPSSLASGNSSPGSTSFTCSTHTGSVSSSISDPRSTGQPASVRSDHQGIKILTSESIIAMPWYTSPFTSP